MSETSWPDENTVAGYVYGKPGRIRTVGPLKGKDEMSEKPMDVRVGDPVEKNSGDYTFCGVVRSVFAKGSGAVRVVVEDERGLLFIFNPGQLTRKEVARG